MNSEIIVLRVVFVIISLIFMGMGIYLPKVKPNNAIGIRTKWALANIEIWNKSNVLAGRLLIVLGAVSIVESLFIKDTESLIIPIYFITLLIAIIIPCIYSYTLDKKMKNIR